MRDRTLDWLAAAGCWIAGVYLILEGGPLFHGLGIFMVAAGWFTIRVLHYLGR